MENKLEVGMYVRFKYGIRKIEKIESINNQKFYCLDESYISDEPEYHYQILESEILGEPSHDITDLIEKDDIIKHPILGIRGITNINVERKEFGVEGMLWCIAFENFKEAFELGTIQILTHEQFEQNSYKIGE